MASHLPPSASASRHHADLEELLTLALSGSMQGVDGCAEALQLGDLTHDRPVLAPVGPEDLGDDLGVGLPGSHEELVEKKGQTVM